LKNSLIILACFLAGFSIQTFYVPPLWVANVKYETYALYVLIVLVGVLVSLDGRAWQTARKVRPQALIVPSIAIAGTATGVIAAAGLLSMDSRHALAVGFGLGYCSQSSILIGEWGGPDPAVDALLAYISRELLTLLAVSLLLKLYGPVAPLVSGGATSMDTTLPIIRRCSGREYAPIALLSSVILTILVPFLVSLDLRF
jgi:uncharacterized membrane protein YbjE (DUF340 family)